MSPLRAQGDAESDDRLNPRNHDRGLEATVYSVPNARRARYRIESRRKRELERTGAWCKAESELRPKKRGKIRMALGRTRVGSWILGAARVEGEPGAETESECKTV